MSVQGTCSDRVYSFLPDICKRCRPPWPACPPPCLFPHRPIVPPRPLSPWRRCQSAVFSWAIKGNRHSFARDLPPSLIQTAPHSSSDREQLVSSMQLWLGTLTAPAPSWLSVKLPQRAESLHRALFLNSKSADYYLRSREIWEVPTKVAKL